MSFLPYKYIKDKKGFSLIEVLAMLAVIGIMFAVAVQSIPTLVEESKVKKTEQELDDLKKALIKFYEDVERFPDDGVTHPLRDLEENNTGYSGWDGPYITSKFEQYGYEEDAWGNEYNYSYSLGEWGDDPCTLYSNGPDEEDNGADEQQDILVNDSSTEVHPGVVKNEIEIIVRRNLAVIQKEAEEYESNNGGDFPNDVSVLKFTESFLDDIWNQEYETVDTEGDSDEDTVVSKGYDGNLGTADDLYPLGG